MDTTRLAELVAELADDLAPAAVQTGAGLGFLLAGAQAVEDDAALVSVLVSGFRMVAIGSYLMAAGAARAEKIGLPARRKLRSGRDLLRELPLAPAAVARLARVGARLEELPQVAREMRDGDLSLDHADAVIRGLDHVQSRVGAQGYAEHKDAVAATLGVHARFDTPAQIGEKAREIAHELAPLDPPSIAPADNPMLNEATIARTDEGRVRLEADLDQASGEKLLTALEPLCKPVPAPDGGRDPRTKAQRCADGLVELVSAYLATPDRPIVGGIVPRVTLTVPLPVLIPDTPLANPETISSGRGADDGGRVPPGGGRGSGDSGRVPVSAASRCIETPSAGSAAAGSVLTGEAVAQLAYTGSVSPRLAREICCGDVEIAALLTADSVSLYAKRHERLATGAVRMALVARDRGCAFPGCGRPAAHTEAHHIVEWAAGGETVVENLVLLCPRHHHGSLHTQGWKVRIGYDGHPWFQPPEVSGETGWIRSHHRRTLTLADTAAA